ncbi:hypothetical protein P376_4408 [Streptomyces sp. HCCB10043]|nr:hypothetical protein P376_4408 [Streptomyces sp. HCCB10043]
MMSGPATVTTLNTQASSQARVNAHTAYGHGPVLVGARPVVIAALVVARLRPGPPGGS